MSTGCRIAILDGIRTPFCKAGGALAAMPADDQGARVVSELLARTGVGAGDVDEVIIGNVAQPAHAANIARVIALKAGLPADTVAYTVHHNCASGMRSITEAALHIGTGECELAIVGGVESMSHIPLLVGERMTRTFVRLAQARTLGARLKALASIRPSHLRPVIALKQGLTDPVCELNMGQTAEILAREFGVDREEQDAFALRSHRLACAAAAAGRLAEEIMPLVVPPWFDRVVRTDDGPRPQQTLDALGKLRPYFDRAAGTVTVGNACPVTDGAAALMLASESKAKALGIRPIAYLTGWAFAALDGRRMGLGPVYATARLLERTGLAMSDFDLVELNEAFAAQVVANERAFESESFARAHLGRSKPVGTLVRERLNVNGGAIALGHPVGTTGTRLVLTLARELARRDAERGLATLCVGGGQGAALVVERAA
jgi:acetyl-CoA C-acetyltransferase/acetyl-CoA acyltransferase